MRALVVGYGSIGRRRAEILRGMGHEVDVVDPRVAPPDVPNGHLWGDIHDVPPHEHEMAFVCTPPVDRASIVLSVTRLRVSGLFVEKPLAISDDDLAELLQSFEVHTVTMGACNLRFAAARVHPDWKIGDGPIYGKGVTLDLVMYLSPEYWNPEHRPISLILDSIHELDLAVALCGPVRNWCGYSEVDEANVSLWHFSGAHTRIEMRRAGRHRSITARDNFGRTMLDVEGYASNAMYLDEMAHFVHAVERRIPTWNPLPNAGDVTALALNMVYERESVG